TAPGAAPAPSAAPAKAAPACLQFDDRTKAAADRGVDVDRITPEPVWRTTCGTLYRSDSRGPQVVFEEGFHAKDVQNGQYDVEKYVLVNQPSPYVSTSYDHDLYKTWYKSGYNYYVDAPGGIDVNKTIGDTHKWADQVEVAFPGGIQRKYIIGVCPVDRQTKTEIMSDCESNPHYQPWH
ncbi:ADP-ribosyltransferase, partial [Streptomyces violaceoruber]